MADKVVSMQQNSDGSFDFSFLFDNGAGPQLTTSKGALVMFDGGGTNIMR